MAHLKIFNVYENRGSVDVEGRGEEKHRVKESVTIDFASVENTRNSLKWIMSLENSAPGAQTIPDQRLSINILKQTTGA